MGWGSLGAVWEGGGTKTRKGMPFWIFLEHVLPGKFGIKVKQKHLKAYSLCSLLRGTILHTVDDVVSTNSKRKWSPLMCEIKTRLVRLKTLECARVPSRDYPGLSRYFAPFHAPSTLGWAMAPSRIFWWHLPLFLFISPFFLFDRMSCAQPSGHV